MTCAFWQYYLQILRHFLLSVIWLPLCHFYFLPALVHTFHQVEVSHVLHCHLVTLDFRGSKTIPPLILLGCVETSRRTLPSCLIPWLVWARVEFNMTFLWNVTAESCQRPVEEVCQLSHHESLKQLRLLTDPLPLHVSCFNKEPGSWQHHFFTMQRTVGTVHLGAWTLTIKTTKCLTEDSAGQFFCTGCRHCVSSCCGASTCLWTWHLSARERPHKLDSECQNFSSVCTGFLYDWKKKSTC